MKNRVPQRLVRIRGDRLWGAAQAIGAARVLLPQIAYSRVVFASSGGAGGDLDGRHLIFIIVAILSHRARPAQPG